MTAVNAILAASIGPVRKIFYTEGAAVLAVIAFATLVVLVLVALGAAFFSLACRRPFRPLFRRCAPLALIPAVAFSYGMFLERNRFVVRPVDVTCETLPEAFDGYRIAHISDIHAASFRHRKGALRRAVKKTNALQADLIAVTGDLITLSPQELEPLQEILAGLTARDGVFSILGNHDYGTYMRAGREAEKRAAAEVVERQAQMGWRLLCNRHEIIRRGADSIAVAGVDNITPGLLFPSTGDLEAALRGLGPCWTVLLSHDPAHWDAEVSDKGIQLMLSGHTHAFQFSLLGWSPSRYLFRQYRGLYRRGESHLYVNPGLGETLFPPASASAPKSP